MILIRDRRRIRGLLSDVCVNRAFLGGLAVDDDEDGAKARGTLQLVTKYLWEIQVHPPLKFSVIPSTPKQV
jgi:hypothetical protein